MAVITYSPGIETVSGSMAKPKKLNGHNHGNYVIGTGIDTFLGINPYTAGSETVEGILKGSVTEMCGAKYFEEHDLDKLAQMMIDRIEEKRAALASCN